MKFIHFGIKYWNLAARERNRGRFQLAGHLKQLILCVKLLRVFLLCLLALHRCLAMPLGTSQCVDESFCAYSLQDYYSQLVNLPNRINERSIATWSYM